MSKFEPLESYLSAKGQYKLLPLQRTRHQIAA